MGHRLLGVGRTGGCHAALQRSMSVSVTALSYQWETTVAMLLKYRDIKAIYLDTLPLQRQLGGALMHA